MALTPYKVTALAESDAQGTDGKNIVVGATVSLFDALNNAVTIYDDATGANGSTAKTTDSSGQVVIWVTPGEYELSVNGGIKRSVVISGNEVQVVDSASDLSILRPLYDDYVYYVKSLDTYFTVEPSSTVQRFGDYVFNNSKKARFIRSNSVRLSQLGAETSSDCSAIIGAMFNDGSFSIVDLEGETWDCSGLNVDNANDIAKLNALTFTNGALVATNASSGESKVQTFAPYLESELQLCETKSPIINWDGLSVLWLGTSIPHQGAGTDGYPERLADKLNFTVQNFAWSGSHASYDVNGDAFSASTVRALSMTEADRLAGLATYGSSSAYDDSFNLVTKASQMTTEYRIKAQFENGAIDCVVLDHNHNDRRLFQDYTQNLKTITSVTVGSDTVFSLSDATGLSEGDGCYVRITGISNLDYAAGRITDITGNQVTVAIDSTGFTGSLSAGELHYVDRNTVKGAFDFLIAYTKNMFIRYGSQGGKIILCGAPSYFTNNVNRDNPIWSVNRAIKDIADDWGLAYFDVASALRLTYRDQLTYLPDSVHPSTPETREVFTNVWAKWLRGGEGNFYNPQSVIQRNKNIDNEHDQPALYSKYDGAYAPRDVIYVENSPIIDDDFTAGLGDWTQAGTGTPTVVSAPWGAGSAVKFDVTSSNTAPYLLQAVALGASPSVQFDFYLPSVTLATGVVQQFAFAAINGAAGSGYTFSIVQSVGSDARLRVTYNEGGYGQAPLIPMPGLEFNVNAATKYAIKLDVVSGFFKLEVNGESIANGAINNSLLTSNTELRIGVPFSNMGSNFSVYIGNVLASTKSNVPTKSTLDVIETLDGLGTAATYDVTTSATDTTANRLLKVGDFGVGVDSGAGQNAPTIGNFRTNKTSGFYRTIGGETDTPLGSSIASVINMDRTGTGGISQIFVRGKHDDNTGQMYFRGGVESAFTDWFELYHSGNSVNPLDYGVGGNGGVVAGDDANNLIEGGFYRVTNTMANVAFAGTSSIIVTRSFNVVSQIQTNGNKTFTRRSTDTGATWQPWFLVYHTGNTNFNEFGKVSAGRVIAGGNANSTTAVRFEFPLVSKTIPTSISITAPTDFEIRSVSGAVIGTVSSVALLPVCSERIGLVEVTITGGTLTFDQRYQLRNLNTNGLTFNF